MQSHLFVSECQIGPYNNYRLLKGYIDSMDIYSYLNDITAEQFEQICFELLCTILPPSYKIEKTRFFKDGGKDIVGTIDGIPYEIWAECKKHTRSVGLQDISKNVVLVISKDIKELFFFSLSKITNSAQRHISIVAEKHGIKVAFYYGNELIKALSSLPEFGAVKDAESSEKPIITAFISEFEDSDKYSDDLSIVLHRDNNFYIDIFIKNRSSSTFNDVTISFNDSKYLIMHIKEIDKSFQLYAHNDRVVQIKCEVLNCKSKHRIPSFIIKYYINGKMETQSIVFGVVNPTKLLVFPLIGQKPTTFMIERVYPIIKKTNRSCLIDIRGESGNGKSRLIKEIINCGSNSGKKVIQIDAIKCNDVTSLKNIICSLLYIPYNNGNINFSSANIKTILERRNGNCSFADAIYQFVFCNQINPENIYFVKQALLNFLLKPVFNEEYILSFDNVQEFTSEMFETLIFLTENLSKSDSKCILLFSTNTEIAKEKNKDNIAMLFRFLGTLSDDYHIRYECSEMSILDAKSMYMHALNTTRSDFVEKLINKSGTRPFDIIMLIKYLQEEKVIEWSNSTWYIPDFSSLEKALVSVPPDSQRLIEKRVNLQMNHEFGENYWQSFKKVIKALQYFKGYVPLKYLKDSGIDDEYVFEISKSLLIKFDDSSSAIVFYHDNIYRFFVNNRTFSKDYYVALNVNDWLKKNPDYPIDNRQIIMFNTYIDVSDYNNAKRYGIICLKELQQSLNYKACVDIGIQLLNTRKIDLSVQERFDVMYSVSNALRERVDHKKGADTFLSTYEYLISHISEIHLTNNDYNKFMHACVNAQINAESPDKAILILRDFEKSDTLDEYYRFIVWNRYAVAYLAVGMAEDSRISIEKALKIANTMNDKELISIANSDMAFIHLNSSEDKYGVIQYFESATQDEQGYKTNLNRLSEILQQRALCLLLQEKLDMALYEVTRSIETSDRIKCSFLSIKGLNLKGAIYCFLGNYDKALSIFEEALSLSESAKSIVGKIKIYTNISAMYLTLLNFVEAKANIDIALSLFESTSLSAIKFKPLFYNYITIYNATSTPDQWHDRILRYCEDNVQNYLDDVQFDLRIIEKVENYGVIKFKNGVFAY